MKLVLDVKVENFMFDHMKSVIHLLPLALLITLQFACAEKIDLNAKILQLEAELAQSPSDETLQTLAELYLQVAENSADADERLRYTWKRGEAARGLKQFDQAAQILSSIYEKHPDSEYASKALFLHAFFLDEDLEDYDQAGQLYRQFLLRYPDSDFHDDAQFLLKNLGKSDEEILEALTNKK